MPWPFYSWARVPSTHCIGGWVDPRAGLDTMEKWKFLTLPGTWTRLLSHPACNQSLYRLCYPGSTSFGGTVMNDSSGGVGRGGFLPSVIFWSFGQINISLLHIYICFDTFPVCQQLSRFSVVYSSTSEELFYTLVICKQKLLIKSSKCTKSWKNKY
jgi:hypothetical protein